MTIDATKNNYTEANDMPSDHSDDYEIDLFLGQKYLALQDKTFSPTANSYFYIGYGYVRGKGFVKDYKQALDWFRKAAKLGHVLAEYNLGVIHEYGFGVSTNPRQANKCFQRAVSSGLMLEQKRLSQLYEKYPDIAVHVAELRKFPKNTETPSQNRKTPRDGGGNRIVTLMKAADDGLAASQNNLGYSYQYGKDVIQSDELAVFWYQKAAAQGHATAQFNLGLMYDNGRGVEQSDKQAVLWYRKAAVQGHATAQFNLGLMYDNGQGVEQSDERATVWYRKAAVQRYASAQNNLGSMYDNGRGVEQSDEQAVLWYRKAADQGDDSAQYNLGWMYVSGRGVEKSDEMAAAWFKKAADQGNAKAQCQLGYMYDKGQGVEQSDGQAVLWYRKAADQGHASAQFNLGVMYANGRGVEQSDKQAVLWYRKAADQGDDSAQYNLGWMYVSGRGVEKSDEMAAAWFKKAADQGNAKAQCQLGYMYDKGQGVEQSEEQAVFWYRKAADQGHASAQLNLGVMYDKGRGVEQSDEQAVLWYRKAADQGNVSAQFNLGWQYANGQGVEQSDEQAFSWYKKAADQGYASAQVNLGLMYENGRGVEQSDEQAVFWYTKAAEQGHASAQFNLGLMYDNGQGVEQSDEHAVNAIEVSFELLRFKGRHYRLNFRNNSSVACNLKVHSVRYRGPHAWIAHTFFDSLTGQMFHLQSFCSGFLEFQIPSYVPIHECVGDLFVFDLKVDDEGVCQVFSNKSSVTPKFEIEENSPYATTIAPPLKRTIFRYRQRRMLPSKEFFRQESNEIPPVSEANSNKTLIFLDFETSGLKPEDGCRTTEVGAVKVVNGRVTETFTSLMNPGVWLSRQIIEITKITNEMVRNAPSPADVMMQLYEFLDGAPIVAHKAKFDECFLRSEFARVDLTAPSTILCSMKLARRIAPGLQSYSLSALSDHFNLQSNKNAHRALPDARQAAALWQALEENLLEQTGFSRISVQLMNKLQDIPVKNVSSFLRNWRED